MRTSSSLTIELAAFLAGAGIYAPHLGAQSAMPSQGSAEQVFADSPSVWFEEYATRARVSPDGRWAIYSRRILDLQRGREDLHCRHALHRNKIRRMALPH